MHRFSGMPIPEAPILHHWLDSTHITFGVVTGGIYGRSWKAEASVFNGREPDSDRANFDFGALDSVSGRFWYLPSRTLAFQISMGHLTDAEAGEAGEPRVRRCQVGRAVPRLQPRSRPRAAAEDRQAVEDVSEVVHRGNDLRKSHTTADERKLYPDRDANVRP